MRVMADDVPVLAGAWLGLIRIDDAIGRPADSPEMFQLMAFLAAWRAKVHARGRIASSGFG